MREHDNEPVRGLPERLPDGERLIWQGAPRWQALALRFHVRSLAIYFAVLLGWYCLSRTYDGVPALTVAASVAKFAGLAAVALGLITLFAWLTARTTVYTVTERRLIVRFGIALSMTINIPFSRVERVQLAAHGRTGNIALGLADTDRVAYFVMWPHVRPWRVKRTEPSLRAVPDAARVARLIGEAVLGGALPEAVTQRPGDQESGIQTGYGLPAAA